MHRLFTSTILEFWMIFCVTCDAVMTTLESKIRPHTQACFLTVHVCVVCCIYPLYVVYNNNILKAVRRISYAQYADINMIQQSKNWCRKPAYLHSRTLRNIMACIHAHPNNTHTCTVLHKEIFLGKKKHTNTPCCSPQAGVSQHCVPSVCRPEADLQASRDPALAPPPPREPTLWSVCSTSAPLRACLRAPARCP